LKNDAYTRVAEPADARTILPGTVPNHTGGAVYAIGDEARARRFLILGTDGGTFYQKERDITRENYDVITRMAATKPVELVAMIEDISVRGLAPKLPPQLFALAVCTAQPGPARAAAFAAFPRIIRTGSHLLMWARYHKALGGKVGRGWRRTVAEWYTSRTPESLAYQMAKYRQRDGWSQKDLIDMSHALAGDESHLALKPVLRWARGETMQVNGNLPPLIRALEESSDPARLIQAGASWEMLPDAALTKADTWNLLLAERKLPMTAALRQLSRLTQLDVFDVFFSNAASTAIKLMFTDPEQLRRARIHPMNVFLAYRQYGEGVRRSGGSYTPNTGVTEMLDRAFYDSFETAPASGMRHLVGVDISQSMTWQGVLGVMANEVATILAMKILRSEPQSYVVGFGTTIHELGLTRTMDLQTALRKTQGNFGATNPGALIEYATKRGIEVDTFVVITDNEVNRGRNVAQLLQAYRAKTGINAKLAVLAVTATDMSIADPRDPGMLDIAGFGADVPALLTEFSRGI
jgi:60 kDa SS-A/Ro ribonucleoprotein